MMMNLQRIRELEFALTAECVYLNHAASAPLPRRTAEVLRQYVESRERLYHLYQTGTQDYDPAPLRTSLAQLLNCLPAEVGFVPSTTDGVALAVNAIDWRPGDNLVIPENDFPGVVYACLNLARRGVEARFSPAPNDRVDLDALIERMDHRTRAVVISHVSWTNGFKSNLSRLGDFCGKHGVLLIVDAIQSLGVQQVDVQALQVDVLVAGCFKWLLGIPGAAIFYVSSGALSQLVPDRAGWMSVKTSAFDPIKFDWRDDALRFLAGAPCEPGLMALKSSVDFLVEMGLSAIEAQTANLTDRLASGLQRIGLTVTSSLDPAHRSSIVNFTTGDTEQDAALVRLLAAKRIIVAPRGGGIRVSPHFYNTEEDIDALLNAIRD